MIRIAVDTLGSDNGSKDIVEGILDFLSKHNDVEIVAVGNKDELKKLEGKCEIVHAPDIVPMEAGPLEVMRMKNSSMYQTVMLAKDKKVDAIVSSGSTGGFLSSSTLFRIVSSNNENLNIINHVDKSKIRHARLTNTN